jgi:hypothetical protein
MGRKGKKKKGAFLDNWFREAPVEFLLLVGWKAPLEGVEPPTQGLGNLCSIL